MYIVGSIGSKHSPTTWASGAEADHSDSGANSWQEQRES